MKLPSHLLLAAATLVAASSASAATATKAATGNDLTVAGSWSGGSGPGFPTSADDATWEGTSLGAGLTVGSDVNWGSINITDALTDIDISGAGKITTGNITLAGTKTLSITNAIALSGNAIYNIANVTGSSAVDATLSGGVSGAFNLTKSGAGTLNLNNATFTGDFSTLGGVTTVTGSDTLIGVTPGKLVAVNDGGTLRQSDGTIRLAGTTTSDSGTSGVSQFIVGSSGYGSYEISGGKLEYSNPYRLSVRNGQITQTGGEIAISMEKIGGGPAAVAGGRSFINGATDVRGVVYATGGTTTITTTNLNNTTAALIVSDTRNSVSGGSELTLAGNAEWSLSGAAGFVAITRDAVTSADGGNLNLNGNSVLTTGKVVHGGSGASGVSRLNFDGGTLKANGTSETNFLTGLTSARIYAGGAKIDTNGRDITIAQALTNPTGNVVTTIPVTNGGSGYTGAPIVSVSGGGGTGATAVANYDPVTGQVTSITITSAGSGYTSAPTFTLSGGGGTGATLGTVTIGAAPTTGGLTKLGAGTLTLSGANTYAGGTAVNAGTLVTGHTSALGSGAVTISGGALQVGTAGVSGIASLTVNTGTLNTTGGGVTTTGAFSLVGGTWTIGDAADGIVAGSFDLSGGFIDLLGFDNKSLVGTYSLISGTGISSLTNANFLNGDSGFTYSMDTNGDLVVSAVPEPSTYGLIGAGALAAVAFVRRRRKLTGKVA